MFGMQATWFRDFNPKNANPRDDDEAWIRNWGLRLQFHRKCQKLAMIFANISKPHSIWNVQFGPLRLYMMSVVAAAKLCGLELIPQTKRVKQLPKSKMLRPNRPIAKPEATCRIC